MNAVRETTLPDGHRAFLITGYAAAREALNHPDLSKDMHTALARDGAVVAEGLPGPAFARHMLSVDPPDHTRLRAMAAKAFTRTRFDALEPKIRLTTDELLSALAAEGDGPVDLVAGFAVPLPFIVIGDLLGIDRPDQQRPAGWFATLLTPYAGEPPPAAVAASDQIVGTSRTWSTAGPPCSMAWSATSCSPARKVCSLGRTCCPRCPSSSSRATTPRPASSATGSRRCCDTRNSGTRCWPTRHWCRGPSRSSSAGTRRCRTRRSATRCAT